MVTGPFGGLMLLLNPLEPSAAAEGFLASGVSRTYLLAEFRALQASDDLISFSGASLHFGLRFEF